MQGLWITCERFAEGSDLSVALFWEIGILVVDLVKLPTLGLTDSYRSPGSRASAVAKRFEASAVFGGGSGTSPMFV